MYKHLTKFYTNLFFRQLIYFSFNFTWAYATTSMISTGGESLKSYCFFCRARHDVFFFFWVVWVGWNMVSFCPLLFPNYAKYSYSAWVSLPMPDGKCSDGGENSQENPFIPAHLTAWRERINTFPTLDINFSPLTPYLLLHHILNWM